MTAVPHPIPAAPRPLGRSGMTTPPLALGGNAMGWTADEATTHAILDRFVDGGFSLVDTADVYSRWVPGHAGGESETIIGNWIATRGRGRLLIATKVGAETGDGGGLSARHIRRGLEGSLRRLRTDVIDIYQAHFDDPAVPIEETLGTFAELIREGKVRAIGLSNHSPERFRETLAVSRAMGLPRYETLQPLYNLYDRAEFETAFAPICEQEGIGVISFYALASGFLTGKYRTIAAVEGAARQRSNRKYLTERGFSILAALDTVAAAHGVKPAQVAIAWLVARPLVTAPIASATSLDQLEELIAAIGLVLTAEDRATLDRASAY